MALLRHKRSVRFGTQLPTFVEPPECECLTLSGIPQLPRK